VEGRGEGEGRVAVYNLYRGERGRNEFRPSCMFFTPVGGKTGEPHVDSFLLIDYVRTLQYIVQHCAIVGG
jgi:hypothetical protein